jgi:putative ABC transport system permease protein
MIDNLYLAWQYVRFNRAKYWTLVACITLVAFLPIALELLLDESEKQLLSRAVTTPLVIGAKGSSLDLVMNSLYFGDEVPEIITMGAAQDVAETSLALPIPVYVRFRARGHPIVGTTVDYFDFRGLDVADGRMIAVLGDCVLGATAAQRLGVGVGDGVVSSPETVFDLAGVYPLRMNIVGVLERTHTSDDLGIFVDLKTAWIMQGLVHGHQDLTTVEDQQLILTEEEGNVVGSPKVFEFTEITQENLDSFHFHGDEAAAPITAVIAVPVDEKSGTILRGRYLTPEAVHQIIVPKEVIDGLLTNIFRIKNVLDAVILVVGLATVLAMILVFALSLRLRRREIDTIFRIGCGRATITRLLAAEIGIIVVSSAVLIGALAAAVARYDHALVRMLFIR